MENFRSNWSINIPKIDPAVDQPDDIFGLSKGPFTVKRGRAYVTSVRKREVNQHQDQYASFDAYLAACNMPPQDYELAVVHMTERPANWELVVQEGFPEFPEDGLLLVYGIIPSSMLHVRKDRKTDM